MIRLSRATAAPQAGIVHLGLGAFSRAHLLQYTENAISRSGGNWGVVGVSLRSPAVRDKLIAQQYAYNALQLNPGNCSARQVEVINNVLVAPENPDAVLEQMADPDIKIVSLTVSEKGYCLLSSSGTLDIQHPDIVHDIKNAAPLSAPGYLVRALAERRRAGTKPFTVLCCDNLPENGQVIKRVVIKLAGLIDPQLAQWIETHGQFPSTMVDRITPATSPEDLQTVQSLTGKYDAAAVVHEPFSQWVLEDNFVGGERPDWGAVGAELVADVRPYELMKLRMLNGTHSALAYLGYLAGRETIADTVADPDFKSFARMLWQNEIIPTVSAPSGVSLDTYAEELLSRYSNTRIRHLNWQIAMDGSQKLPQRILGTLQERLAADQSAPGLILSVAAWMRYVRGVDETGVRIDVRDPHADRFAELAKRTGERQDWVDALLAERDIFPEQIARQISEPLIRMYGDLIEVGAQAMVRRVVRSH